MGRDFSPNVSTTLWSFFHFYWIERREEAILFRLLLLQAGVRTVRSKGKGKKRRRARDLPGDDRISSFLLFFQWMNEWINDWCSVRPLAACLSFFSSFTSIHLFRQWYMQLLFLSGLISWMLLLMPPRDNCEADAQQHSTPRAMAHYCSIFTVL